MFAANSSFLSWTNYWQTDISHGDYETYVPMLQEKFADVSKEDVLKRVAAMEFDRFLKYYENAEDLNVREERRDKRERADVRGSRAGGGSRDRERTYGDRGNRNQRERRFYKIVCKPWYQRWFL